MINMKMKLIIYNEFFYRGAKVIYEYIIDILNVYINNKLNQLVSDLTDLSKMYLKEEWERVKLESKLGDINYEVETSDGIEIDEIRDLKQLKNWTIYKKFKEKNLKYKIKYLFRYMVIFVMIMISLIISIL